MATPRLEVGRIVKAHGIRGEVIVDAVSNRPGRFAPGAVLVGHAGGGEGRPFVVLRAQPQGRRWIVAFEGVETRTQAEALRDVVLTGEPGQTSAGELWVHELVGADVWDLAGMALGQVVAVEANPASDLLVLADGGLIPLTFVVESAPGRVVVDLPSGLLDL